MERCHREYCRYLHVSSKDEIQYRETLYQSDTMRYETLRTLQISGICQEFKQFGNCKYGSKCKFTHRTIEEQENDKFICPVCFSEISMTSWCILNPCMHSTCEGCLRELIARDMPQCPVCRGQIEEGSCPLSFIGTFFFNFSSLTPI